MKRTTPPLPSGGVAPPLSSRDPGDSGWPACLSVKACLPQERGRRRRRRRGTPTSAGVPHDGSGPRELLIDGLLYDFTARPTSLDLWGPPVAGARCAATRITDTLGPPRLSELGYRPATSGASLNDIDLTDTERELVAAQFTSCVDMREAIAAVLMGDGHMEAKEATCLADGLVQQGVSDQFARAWAFGRTVNPAEGRREGWRRRSCRWRRCACPPTPSGGTTPTRPATTRCRAAATAAGRPPPPFRGPRRPAEPHRLHLHS